MGLLPVGFAIVGVLTDCTNPALLFVGSGLLCLSLAIVALCVRDIRQLK
jgi:hypothetical protein